MPPKLIVFDRKGDFGCLTEVAKDFLYIPLSEFRENPLRNPARVDMMVWLHSLLEVWNIQDWRVATRNFLASVILGLYELYGFTGKADQACPCILDLKEKLDTMGFKGWSRHQLNLETAQNRIGGIANVLGKNYECSSGMGELLDSKVSFAIDLVGIPTDFQNLVITSMTAKLLVQRMVSGERESGLKTLVLLDEGQTIFRRRYELRDGTYFLSELIQMAREFGIGVVVAAQSMDDLAHSLLANTATKVLVGGFGRASDTLHFARTVGVIEPEKQQYLTKSLVTGLACISDPRYAEPFIAQIPFVPIDKSTAASTMQQRFDENRHLFNIEPRLPLSGVLQKKQAGNSATPRAARTASKDVPPEKAEVTPVESPIPEVTQEESRFVYDILHYPDDGLAERYARLGLSGSASQRVKKGAIRKGFVIEHRETQRGGSTTLLELTQRSYDLLGVKKPKERGIGHFGHQHFQKRAVKSGREGVTGTIEAKLANEKSVDLLFIDENGEKFVVEYETQVNSHIIVNITRDLDEVNGITKIIIVAPNMKVMKGIEKLVESSEEVAQFLEMIEITIASRFLKGEVL